MLPLVLSGKLIILKCGFEFPQAGEGIKSMPLRLGGDYRVFQKGMLLHVLPIPSILIGSGEVCLVGRSCLPVSWTCSKAFCPICPIRVFRQGNIQFLPLSDLGMGVFRPDRTKVSPHLGRNKSRCCP